MSGSLKSYFLQFLVPVENHGHRRSYSLFRRKTDQDLPVRCSVDPLDGGRQDLAGRLGMELVRVHLNVSGH
jgi:hypothetical protein